MEKEREQGYLDIENVYLACVNAIELKRRFLSHVTFPTTCSFLCKFNEHLLTYTYIVYIYSHKRMAPHSGSLLDNDGVDETAFWVGVDGFLFNAHHCRATSY